MEPPKQNADSHRPTAVASGFTPLGDQPEIRQDLFCQDCGYNLRGLTSGRCPECGRSLDTVRSLVPQIPWVYRAERGRFRTYWATVWLAMFRQTRFCDEMARPVSFPDSQAFRWVTVLHVYIPILIATLIAYAVAQPGPFGNELFNTGFFAVWPVVVMHVFLLLYLAAATGLPSYFFHPRGVPVGTQNRAIALSYYACGPLAITPLPLVAGVVSSFLGLDNNWGMGLAILACSLPCGQAAAWILDLTHIYRRILPQRKRRGDLIAAGLPLLWIILAAVLLLGLPSLIFCVAIFVFGVG